MARTSSREGRHRQAWQVPGRRGKRADLAGGCFRPGASRPRNAVHCIARLDMFNMTRRRQAGWMRHPTLAPRPPTTLCQHRAAPFIVRQLVLDNKKSFAHRTARRTHAVTHAVRNAGQQPVGLGIIDGGFGGRQSPARSSH